MSELRTHVDFLNDIASSAMKAISFAQGMSLESFREDEKTTFACIRALELIGEAKENSSNDSRSRSDDSVAFDVWNSR